MDETVLFFLSEGGDVRCTIVRLVKEANDAQEGIYLNVLAEELGMSHVAARKHVQLLLEEGYLAYKNPDGNPKYLELTEKGEDIYAEIS